MNSPTFLTKIADQLKCSPARAEQILRAVMHALRDGLNDRESATIESSLPENLRPLWPKAAGTHPGLADLGDIGFLGRVQELAAATSEGETKKMVRVVMSLLMNAMAIPGDDRAAAWSALTHLPRDQKVVWMKLFRSACFPVELLAQRPVKTGRRFSKNARTPS
ncbi:MAG TPA: DUF2267 domain-containing protein [Sporolactobacillaceae bacterium]|nr:DUF2267 domain-containing protein [Sporolactobacillaceae bacterium]